MKYHVGQRFKNRISKRKAEITKVQSPSHGVAIYTLKFEDDLTYVIQDEGTMLTQWYHIPKGEGKQKEDKPAKVEEEAKPVPLKGKAK